MAVFLIDISYFMNSLFSVSINGLLPEDMLSNASSILNNTTDLNAVSNEYILKTPKNINFESHINNEVVADSLSQSSSDSINTSLTSDLFDTSLNNSNDLFYNDIVSDMFNGNSRGTHINNLTTDWYVDQLAELIRNAEANINKKEPLISVPADHELSIFTNQLYDGIDWMYSYSETLLAYEFRFWSFLFFSSYFDHMYDFFFKFFWFFCIDMCSHQLVYSTLLDFYINTLGVDQAKANSWVYNVYFSRESTLFFIHHPEIMDVSNQITSQYILKFNSYLTSVVGLLINNESFVTVGLLIPQLLLIVWLFTLGIMFYFSYYSSSVKEESLIDLDHAFWNVTVEAEEEIASMDDILMAFIVIFYVFGWFFYAHCWMVISQFPELMLVMYVFPFLYYIILLIPTFLVFDFGIYFLGYLKGVGSSPVMLLELVYDYISFAAFYIRVLVQAVRLLLMSFTYASLHDFIIFYSLDQRWLAGSESIWEDLNNLTATDGTFSYFAFFSILGKIYYWLYELLHTFFVVTAQATAFFAMVFWLFFFLFTFFVSEKQEFYYFEKRKKKK